MRQYLKSPVKLDRSRRKCRLRLPRGPGKNDVRRRKRLRHHHTSSACIGGACFSLPTPARGRVFSQRVKFSDSAERAESPSCARMDRRGGVSYTGTTERLAVSSLLLRA